MGVLGSLSCEIWFDTGVFGSLFVVTTLSDSGELGLFLGLTTCSLSDIGVLGLFSGFTTCSFSDKDVFGLLFGLTT